MRDRLKQPLFWVQWVIGGGLLIIGLNTTKWLWLVGLIIFIYLESRQPHTPEHEERYSKSGNSASMKWLAISGIGLIFVTLAWMGFKYLTTGYTTL